ncbi:MAG: NAD(P)-dependent oxidoreductase [Spirochaetes bacterium]|nr:NAD(P)-dependent oxidoreductase [Spirochaetota bacterium]
MDAIKPAFGPDGLPERLEDEAHADQLITEPSPRLVDLFRRLEGDLAILGVAGKMGVHLAVMAARAAREAGVKRKIYGVARFSDPGIRLKLEENGVTPVAADLTQRAAVDKLPDASNVVFMAGKKFGTTGSEDLTWAMNTIAPSFTAERYPKARTVVYSTGCVYPFVSPATGGSTEDQAPAPIGDYAQSALGRERIFSYHAGQRGLPVCLFRLNYAIEPRYGVLRDIGEKVWKGEPVGLSNGWVNLLWQGDAVLQSLLCLELASSPAAILNVTGPELLSVRRLALEFGRRFGKEPVFTGEEKPEAFISSAARACALFGYPRVPVLRVLDWTADWISRGLKSLGKPTHFEESSGKF